MRLLLFFPVLMLFGCSTEKKVDAPNDLTHYFGELYQEWKLAGASLDTEKLPTYSIEKIEKLQPLIDSLANEGGGVVLLKNGIYKIEFPIQLKENIFIKGEDKEKTIIKSSIRSAFEPSPFDTPCTLEFIKIKNSGIENIQLVYGTVPFPPFSPQNFYDTWDNTVFKNDPQGDTLLYSGHIGIKNSENILIRNCVVKNAGTDPIIIAGSSFVTVENSTVSGSYNKGAKGNGYFNIDLGSHHVLIKNNFVEKIRHLAIQKNTHHNVIVDNYLEVDVNFHNGDAGKNLVEGNTIRIPVWHGWHCFSAGAKSKHEPPGKQNYLFNNFTQYKLAIPEIRENITEFGDSIIYESRHVVDTVWIKERPMLRYDYGEITETPSSNRLFTMNHEWEGKKRVLLVDTLSTEKIY